MIFDSVPAMTVVDLVVISVVTAVSVAFWRQGRADHPAGLATAPRLILAGLACIALFYLADLLSMHVLPSMIGTAGARQLTTRMHLDASWVVTLASVILISAGFLHSSAVTRRALAAREASEVRYRSIVSDQSEYIVRWRPDGFLIWVNDPFCEVFGASRDELIGASFLTPLTETDCCRIVDEIERLTPASPTRTGVRSIRLPGGKTGWQEWTDRALFDENGQLIEIQSVGRDVTDRIRTAKALEESEARFRGFVESTSDWVWEMDSSGRHIYSNRRVFDILGYTPEELAGRHWHELTHPDDLAAMNARYQALLGEKRGWKQWVVRSRHRDGSFRYFESSAEPILDGTGKVVGYRGIDRDATFVTLMSKASSSLIGCPTAELDERIERTFAEIALAYGLERISFWAIEGGVARRCHEWAAAGHAGPVFSFASDKKVPATAEALRRGNMVRLESLDELPPDSPDRAFLAAQGVRSTMAVPLVDGDRLIGVAVFSTVSRRKQWSDGEESDLRHLAEKIFAAYTQSEATRKIVRRERDLAQSEALAHVGSFAYYPQTMNAIFPEAWFAEFSPEQCALLETKPDEASFELFISRVHPDDRQLVYDAANELFDGGSEIERQFRVINPSGKTIHFAIRMRIDRDELGRNLRVIGACRDITDQVLKEQSLQAALGEIEDLRDRLELENIKLREEVRTVKGFEQIVGDSEALRSCLDLVARAAPTDATILLLGDTGTGKELIAKAIHELSSRRDRRMVSLNCTALPAELVESELFGHEKGAFTGAHQMREGRFETANGGTLFLDEIGDLPRRLQGKLLRVLQDGCFERVGGTATLHADVRLIAATNRDLKSAVERGEFRSDLYYRINTVPIHLPSLRERKEDIPLLAQHFVHKHAPKLDKSIDAISAGMLRYLQEQDWPGNIRELEHFIERCLIASSGPVLTLGERDSLPGSATAAGRPGNGSSTDLRSIEREHIVQVLTAARWIIGGPSGAAAKLGLPPSTLRSKMHKLGIARPGERRTGDSIAAGAT